LRINAQRVRQRKDGGCVVSLSRFSNALIMAWLIGASGVEAAVASCSCVMERRLRA
jgi:hypothetical protein